MNPFEDAADLIERDGWCQNRLHQKDVILRPVMDDLAPFRAMTDAVDIESCFVKTVAETKVSHCAYGALDWAMLSEEHRAQLIANGGHSDSAPQWEYVAFRLRAEKYLVDFLTERNEEIPDRSNSYDKARIPAWNDAKGRTQQEVLDFLRFCGKKYEEEKTA